MWVICRSFTKRKRACSAIPRSFLWNKRREIKFNLATVVFYEIPVTIQQLYNNYTTNDRFIYFYRMVRVIVSVVSIKLTKFKYISSCLFYCLEKRITVKVIIILLDSVFSLQYNDILDWLIEISVWSECYQDQYSYTWRSRLKSSLAKWPTRTDNIAVGFSGLRNPSMFYFRRPTFL